MFSSSVTDLGTMSMRDSVGEELITARATSNQKQDISLTGRFDIYMLHVLGSLTEINFNECDACVYVHVCGDANNQQLHIIIQLYTLMQCTSTLHQWGIQQLYSQCTSIGVCRCSGCSKLLQ